MLYLNILQNKQKSRISEVTEIMWDQKKTSKTPWSMFSEREVTKPLKKQQYAVKKEYSKNKKDPLEIKKKKIHRC